MDAADSPSPQITPEEEFQRCQYTQIVKFLCIIMNKILIPMCHKILFPVPTKEKFLRHYLRLKDNKHWLKDVRNRSSFRAIKAHLRYCQEDFQAMVNLQGKEKALERTKGWDPMNLTVNHFYHRVESPPRHRGPPRPSSSMTNPHSRHPKNIQRNRAWRSSIYEEMIRMARSLQGTYQHLEKGKIQKQQAMQLDPPDF